MKRHPLPPEVVWGMAEDNEALRARCAELEGERDAAVQAAKLLQSVREHLAEARQKAEAERDAAKAEAEKLKEEWHNEQCAHCGDRPEGHNGTMWCAECFEWWVRESEQECITQLRADLDAARASEARAVEALKEIDEYSGGAESVLDDEYVTERRMEAINGGESALAWLAQDRREAARQEACRWVELVIGMGSPFHEFSALHGTGEAEELERLLATACREAAAEALQKASDQIGHYPASFGDPGEVAALIKDDLRSEAEALRAGKVQDV